MFRVSKKLVIRTGQHTSRLSLSLGKYREIAAAGNFGKLSFRASCANVHRVLVRGAFVLDQQRFDRDQ